MRLGVATGFNATSGAEWAKLNKDLGLSSVVFPLNYEADSATVKEYVQAARENDLVIAEVGIWRNAIDMNPTAEKANLEYSIRQLAFADEIGARCCVNIAGAYCGNRWDGAVRENFGKDAWNKSIKMIQKVIDEVQPKNTYFTMEPMPWMIPSSPQEYLHMLEDVARDRFAVHLDAINMITSPQRYFFAEEFLEECFTLLRGKIKSCHLKDVRLLDGFTFQLLECACGEGNFPIEKYAELATAEDPNMPMIIEHLHEDEEYRASVAYVRKRLGI